ncbi:sigma-70 family RNA polymerase sigma factor [Candidatus Poribacteria bacterium]|nr:sigma-70 family RNA polymerase sigma factor [Candidatus Poribacteria bacterium]
MQKIENTVDMLSTNELDSIDEITLVTRFQNGDTSAFNTLVLKYQDQIAKLIYKYVKDVEATKDLSQEVFLKAYKALPRFKHDSAFYSWLYRIAENCCIDFQRKQKRRQNYLYDELPKTPEECLLFGSFPSPSHFVEMEELGDMITKAITHLPPKQQEVFKLRYDQKLLMKEIALHINRSEGTVKTHLHKAHRKLRELLRPYLENKPLEWVDEK